jgi:hypothetical protein
VSGGEVGEGLAVMGEEEDELAANADQALDLSWGGFGGRHPLFGNTTATGGTPIWIFVSGCRGRENFGETGVTEKRPIGFLIDLQHRRLTTNSLDAD